MFESIALEYYVAYVLLCTVHVVWAVGTWTVRACVNIFMLKKVYLGCLANHPTIAVHTCIIFHNNNNEYLILLERNQAYQ